MLLLRDMRTSITTECGVIIVVAFIVYICREAVIVFFSIFSFKFLVPFNFVLIALHAQLVVEYYMLFTSLNCWFAVVQCLYTDIVQRFETALANSAIHPSEVGK